MRLFLAPLQIREKHLQAGLVLRQGYVPEKHRVNRTQNYHLE